jgi:LuxR family transcriptional regulator, maltose regulon positive regulatory protein
VCDAVLLFHAGVLVGIPDRITRARELLQDRPEDERLPIEATLRSLEVGLSRARGDMPEVIARTTDLLAMLPQVRHGLTSVLQYRAIALNNKGIGLLWTGQHERADRYLSAASTVARAAGIELVAAHAAGHLALLEVLYGSLQEASHLAESALDLAERRGFRSALQAAPAHLALALVNLERNNVAEAERAVQQGLSAHRTDPEPAQAKVLLGTRARLLIAQDELENAHLILEQAQREASPGTRVPALDRWLLRAESEIDLRRGHPHRVLTRYGGMADDGELTPPERVCLARAAFATGNLRLTEVLLARPLPPTSDVVSAVEAWILTALIADVQGQHTRSIAALGRAFAIAEQEGVRRPFVSMGGEKLYELVARQRRLTADDAPFVADVLIEMETARKATEPPRAARDLGERELEVSHLPTVPPAGDLSERELDVLRYLPTMLTAGEIAVDLHVSVNTVKAHMRSIYRKLDASRRREAVVRARERGIL